MTQPIDLSPDHAKIVHEIIARLVPGDVSVRVFGSRAKWTAKPYSDLDLALKGKEPLSLAFMAELAEAFDESDLPFRVDVVDWHSVSPSFQAVIDRDGVRLGVPLGELVRHGILEIGDGYRAKNEELGGNGPIFLRAAYLQDTGFVSDLPERFLQNELKKFGQKVAQHGDVVITTKGNSTGRVGVVRHPQIGAIYSPHLSYWRSKKPDRLSQSFLRFWSMSPECKSQIRSMSLSTDMAPYLSLRDQARIEIPLIEIDQQTAIASVLSALDDKIELNRRMNETLEGMAQAIFKDWFVDFGPARRKLSGITDPVAIMGDLTPDAARATELAALFPDALGDDGLPVGWSIGPIYDVASVIYGAPFASSRFNSEKRGRPLIRIRDLSSHSSDIYTDEVHRNEYIIHPGAIVVGMDGEFQARVWQGAPSLMNQRLCAFEAIEKSNRAFVLFSIRPQLLAHEKSAIGTTVIHLGKKEIDRFTVLRTGSGLLKAFSEVADTLLSQIVENGLQNCTLAETRDYLLPKLMSGEVRVRDAETLAEGALA